MNTVLVRKWHNATATPETVPAMFRKMVEKNKNQIALAIPIVNYEDGDLRKIEKKEKIARRWTYREYYDDCILAAKGLIGVKGYYAFISSTIIPPPVWTRDSPFSVHTGVSLSNLAHCKHGCYHGRVCCILLVFTSSLLSTYSGKSVGIDQDSSPKAFLKIANHSLANIVVVDNPQKILKV